MPNELYKKMEDEMIIGKLKDILSDHVKRAQLDHQGNITFCHILISQVIYFIERILLVE